MLAGQMAELMKMTAPDRNARRRADQISTTVSEWRFMQAPAPGRLARLVARWRSSAPAAHAGGDAVPARRAPETRSA